ncbi:MAG TPA: hypothetical protein VH300_18375 [Thermoleophilaceae bacterium]|nr:hypothetical protein [Thermoleophilaceae bacterium]
MSEERGQATIEWITLLLLVSLVFAAAIAFVPAVDGRPFGAMVARALVCAVKQDCRAEGAALRRAYGDRDAAVVRANAPNILYEPGTLTLPVDYRRCRSHRCADAPDDRDLDVHRSARGGTQATVFTHVVRKRGKTYLQYWFYYPESATEPKGLIRVTRLLGLRYKGLHPDDWEGYQVRIEANGTKSVRATKHGGYTWCKGWVLDWHNDCIRWGRPNGWTRVSRGSHAGHIPEWTPANGLRERSTTAPAIHLVPLETLDQESYRPLEGSDIKPPWKKTVYTNPTDESS